MGNQNLNNKVYREEISLVHYINILIKRKFIVVIPFLISIVVLFAINKKSVVIFEQSSVVKIGSFSSPIMSVPYATRMIRNQSVLVNAISKYKLNSNINELKSMFNSGEIKILGQDDQFLKITVESYSPEKATSIAKALAIEFVEKGNEVFLKKKAFLENQLRIFQDKQFLKKNYFGYQENLKNLLQINDELLSAEEFEVVVLPSTPAIQKKTDDKKRLLMIPIAGLLLGIICAFFLEFWVNNFRKNN